MKLWLGLIFVVLFSVSAHAQSKSVGTGSICIAPPDRPTTGEKSLANPAGGNPISVYSIQVDKMSAVVAANDRSVRIWSVSTSRKHLMKIIGDGKVVQSFWFTFNEFKTKTLCLWFKSLYETWSLWDAKDARAMCTCK
jgi:WD40 repeat protein